MTDIVEEACTEEGFHALFGTRENRFPVHGLLKEAGKDQKADMVDSQAVVKPGVHRTGVEVKGRPELLDPSQLLKNRVADDRFEGDGKADVLPQGVADAELLFAVKAAEQGSVGALHA